MTKALHYRHESSHRQRTPLILQAPLSKWPAGATEIALTLRHDVERIQAMLGLQFQHGSDSLDDFDAAILVLPQSVSPGDPRHIIFQAYRDSPDVGTHVILQDSSIPILRHLVKILNLKREDVEWVREDVASNLESALHPRRILSPYLGKTKFLHRVHSGFRKLRAS